MVTRIFTKHTLTFISCLVIVAFASVTLLGCASDSSAGKGAAGGAFLGAIAGALLNPKDPWAGALVGAAAGAVIGAIAGFAWDYASKQSKDYAQTSQDTRYRPEQGDKVSVTDYTLNPTQTAAGNPVQLNTRYYVMTPDASKDLNVQEIRYVKRYNPSTGKYEELGRDKTNITMKPGTRDGSGKIAIPKDAEEGNYSIGFGVAYKDRKDEREVPVKITRAYGKLQVHIAQVTER